MSDELRDALRAIFLRHGIDIDSEFATSEELIVGIRQIDKLAGDATLTDVQRKALLDNLVRSIRRTASADGRESSVVVQSLLPRWMFLRQASAPAADAYIEVLRYLGIPVPTIATRRRFMIDPAASARVTIEEEQRVLREAERALRVALAFQAEPQFRAAMRVWGVASPIEQFNSGDGQVVEPTHGARQAVLFTVWDSGERPGYRMPFQALLVGTEDGTWALNWLVSQCTSCLGDGTIGDGRGGDDICGTCGGSGWGFPDSVEFPYTPGRIAAA